jgi:hypothetical protein
MSMTRSIFIVVAGALCAALSQPALAATIEANSGTALCGALTAADFTAVGITGTAKPHANVMHPSAAYCVFEGSSGQTGGVEADVFYWAGINEDVIKQHEQTLIREMGGNIGAGSYKKIQMSGVDDAYLATGLQRSGPRYASIIVRKAYLILIVTIPPGPRASDQLTKLATVALQRF